ncbi:MAG: ABC transporter substrate-binding protein [Chromatiales bacterium]|nr:ABC transporter substrate-binding protein [Chromatiales bacterium]
MKMQNLARATALGLSALIASGCATAPRVDPDVAKGRQQLVDALDAGWIRVVASGKDRQILASQPPSKPGAALSYMVTLADCLPQPDLAPFPEKPVGLFKEILDRGTIRQVVQTTTNTPNDTSFFFSSISDAQFQAVLDEINAHYKVNLKIENVVVPPGPMPSTSLVVEGKADIVSQLNATGGDTQGMRRRTSRRFTCTMSAISQYIHIPAKSQLAKEINTVDDLSKRKGLRICTGPLATQTARAFFPQHTVSTKYLNDLTGCDKDIQTGKADLIINPLPSLSIGGLKGYKSVHTLIVAGTPLWVAREDIECPSDGNPRTEDKCFRVE